MTPADTFSVAQGKPRERIAGRQSWRHLFFLHWSMAPEILASALPAPLHLDTWEGLAYVGIVPFQMQRIRPAWLPAVCGLNFLETNVRTYVTHRGQPGVYFFSLDANSHLAVNVARWQWGLPYYFAHMTCARQNQRFVYESRRPTQTADTRFELQIADELGESHPNTLEYFLLERYYLFVERRGTLWSGHVQHVPYPAYRADVLASTQTLVEAAGLPPTNRPPDLAHYSPGVDVQVFRHSGPACCERIRHQQ
ncbi:MAG: DUF2071 domain-containing protein [Planctomycetales bacterium]|nr:DUF2071 domain-containing protein [Planctomycetales bacterium]